MLKAKLQVFPEQVQQGVEVDAYVRRVQELVDRALTLTSGLAPEVRQLVAGIDDPMRLAYLLGTMLDLKAEEKQQLLEADPLLKKLELVHSLLTREVSVLELKGKIESQAQQEMSDAQKQYYLRQQMKAIQDELGEGEGNETTRPQGARLPRRNCRRTCRWSPTARSIGSARMGPASPEYQMLRTYLDWMLELPWTTVTEDRIDPDRGAPRARRGSLRSRQGQGTHRRIPRRPQAEGRHEGADPVLRRAARRRQDVARPVDRARDAAQVRAHLARRRP